MQESDARDSTQFMTEWDVCMKMSCDTKRPSQAACAGALASHFFSLLTAVWLLPTACDPHVPRPQSVCRSKAAVKRSPSSLPWLRALGTCAPGAGSALRREVLSPKEKRGKPIVSRRPLGALPSINERLHGPLRKSLNSISWSAPVIVSSPACELGSPGMRCVPIRLRIQSHNVSTRTTRSTPETRQLRIRNARQTAP